MKLCAPILAFVLSLASLVGADEPTPSLSKTSELARAGSVINLPGLRIHGGNDKFIEADGKVALTDGILEFIAVQSEGRAYESLLTLDCKPSELKFALLLIGCEADEKQGSQLALEIEWQQDGKPKRVPVEELLIDRHTKKPATKLAWRFTGSTFVKDLLSGREVFQADQEAAFIALWWEPAVLINIVGDHGNPYRADDQGFEVLKTAVPPTGTPVKLILRRRVQ
jgi:hypothetical protein